MLYSWVKYKAWNVHNHDINKWKRSDGGIRSRSKQCDMIIHNISKKCKNFSIHSMQSNYEKNMKVV